MTTGGTGGGSHPAEAAELRRQIADRDAEVARLRAQLRNSDAAANSHTDEEYRRCLEELMLMREESSIAREQSLAAQHELARSAHQAKLTQNNMNEELQNLRFQLTDVTVSQRRKKDVEQLSNPQGAN